ncbi:2-oxo acid dehydrogenase subunit E2 [Candidatus Pacearchaeota archaeon]|nr:2-oxo acid dehydrogenase subunit E2 [Candidatus Pacearchaeota archaeon]
MPFEFKFPDVGEGIQEGHIIKWLVKEGDEIKEDQTIVQVETDKAVVDLPSPKSGKIGKINYRAGETVKVGSTLLTILGKNEKSEKPQKIKEIPKTTEKKKGQSVVGELEEAPEEIEEKPITSVIKGTTQTQKVLASPAIRKLAAEHNIDLTKIKGSGPAGRILEKDISNNAHKKTQIPHLNVQVKSSKDSYGETEKIPLIGIRKTIALNMIKSSQIPQVTITENIDISKLWAIREKEKIQLEKQGIKLTLLPFIIKTIIAALKEYPLLNASLENDEIILKKYYNIGVAVETPVGLVVPVIKNAENKTITQIANEITSLAESSRSRQISLEELKGSTFTITNYGSVGGLYGTPLLNPGESAIIGLGRIFENTIHEKINKSKKFQVKTIKILPISLTFDHRILDGAEAVRFLVSLKTFLEDPSHLLIEMK